MVQLNDHKKVLLAKQTKKKTKAKAGQKIKEPMLGIFCLRLFSFLGYACVFLLVLWLFLIQILKYHDYAMIHYSMISDMSFSYFFRPFEPGYLHLLLVHARSSPFRTQGLALLKNTYTTVEPRFNEGPGDWQNVFAVLRFCYIEVLFHISCYDWGKENRSLYRGLRYIEVPLYLLCGLVCQ